MSRLDRIAPELPASHLEEAIAYYECKLGFKVAMRIPASSYAIVERDGVAIHLFADHSQRSAVGVHVFTNDLEQVYAEFSRSGATITQAIEKKPWGNRDFRVRDEYGNELKFTEPLG
jgi:uncharacterized glyoxalase superfamily protein PhnB